MVVEAPDLHWRRGVIVKCCVWAGHDQAMPASTTRSRYRSVAPSSTVSGGATTRTRRLFLRRLGRVARYEREVAAIRQESLVEDIAESRRARAEGGTSLSASATSPLGGGADIHPDEVVSRPAEARKELALLEGFPEIPDAAELTPDQAMTLVHAIESVGEVDIYETRGTCGTTILDTIAKLNEQATRPKLSARVGIDSGAVVVGADAGKDADVFGDAPNIAARVQAAAEPDTVLITDATHRLVSGLFIVEDRGAYPLKGIERPMQLYRVVQPSGVRGRFEAAAASRGLTPFVGREDELRALMNRWERALEGEGQVALIIGEAGIGK